jgi:hypothetical protein
MRLGKTFKTRRHGLRDLEKYSNHETWPKELKKKKRRKKSGPMKIKKKFESAK